MSGETRTGEELKTSCRLRRLSATHDQDQVQDDGCLQSPCRCALEDFIERAELVAANIAAGGRRPVL
jgi:hypothetical protein